MRLRNITTKDTGATIKSDDQQGAAVGFVGNIEDLTHDNENFREVIYTAKNCQLVLMTIQPGEDVGTEVHDVAQFFRVEEGTGEVNIGGRHTNISEGYGVITPAGVEHNILNTGDTPLKIYTIYCPPHHKDGVAHATREEAEADEEHFDGETTE